MVDAGLRAAYEYSARNGELGDNPDSWEQINAASDADPALSTARDEARDEARNLIEGALSAYEP